MLKKKVKLVCNALLVFTILSMYLVMPASAAISEEPAPYGQDSLNQVCIYCGGWAYPVCVGNPTYYTTGKGSHLPSSSCNVHFYRSDGMLWCSECYKNNESYGKHDCYQVHSSCGKGTVNTCTMGYLPDID